MIYRMVKYKKGDVIWFEIEKRISLLFGLFRFWVAYTGGDSEDSAFININDAEQKLHELRFPKMIEKEILNK